MSFNERLRVLRNQKGFSQSKLAQLTGLDKAAIGRWETTSITPSDANLTKLASAFGISVEELRNPTWRGFTDIELIQIKDRIKTLSPANQRLIDDLISSLSLVERTRPK